MENNNKQQKIEEKLKYHIELEQVIFNISSRLINLPSDEIEKEIENSLKLIGEFTKSHIVYLFIFDKDVKTVKLYEWCNEGITSRKKIFQNLSADSFPWGMNQLKNGEPLHILSVADMPEQAAKGRQLLEAQGVHSVVFVPMFLKNNFIGSLGLLSLNKDKTWVEEDFRLLKMLSQIFLNTLERKNMDEKLKKNNEQMRHVQKMEAIGRLAGGVAHEFNNLLTTIHGYTQLGMMEIKPEQLLYEYLKEIESASIRAASLTRQLLIFSHQHLTSFVLLNINTTIEEIFKMLKRIIGEDILINIELEPMLWPVNGDTASLSQVIMNLAINAKEAMPHGGTLFIKTNNIILDEVNVSFSSEIQPGKYVCISITDTGIGMSQELISKIFDPFFTTKGMAIAPGLGLSVVYGIIRQHKGSINVYSEQVKGTTFTIYLPAVIETPEYIIQDINFLQKFQGNKEKILIIEDEKSILEMTRDLLVKNNYVVLEAEDAKNAIEIFEKEKGNFDLIFSDVILPDKNGIEVVEEFLAINPALRVLFSSGYTDEKSQWLVIHKKGFKFIQKPYLLNNLLKIIKELLRDNYII